VYFTRSGTATFGAAGDYTLSTLLATSVVILSGQPSVDITVTPVDNSLAEPNETVILTLAANATYNLAPTVPQRTATVTILDND
jgi:anaerobic C4-dicarboxylate transporter